MDGSEEVHRYRQRAPRWMQGGTKVILVIQGVLVLVSFLAGGFPLGQLTILGVLLVVVLVSPTLERRYFPVLEIGPRGINYAGVETPWDEIATIEPRPLYLDRWGAKRDAFVLKEPRPISKAADPSGASRTIPLAWAFPDWRGTEIQADIERWAPHLLQP